jgi:hypothetical protein
MDSDSGTVQQFVAGFGATREALWRVVHPGNINEVHQAAKQLQIHTKVQGELAAGLENLHKSPISQHNDQRIKNLYKFVFGQLSGNVSKKKRSRQLVLRGLDPASFILCSLSYTVGGINQMDNAVFDYLIDNVARFAQLNGPSTLLRRADISKSVMSCITLEADDPIASGDFFRAFFTCKLADLSKTRDSILG